MPLAGAAALAIASGGCGGGEAAEEGAGDGTYYVDSARGSDEDAGTSPGRPWRTLAPASSAPLGPGARLLLRRGSRWTDELRLAQSGSRERPIVVGAYGAGERPLITGSSPCVTLDGSWITLTGVAVSGCATGIAVNGDGVGVERNLVSDNVTGVRATSEAADTRILDNVLRDNNRMAVLTRTPTDDDSGAWAVLLQGEGAEVAYNDISGSDAFSHDYGRDGAAVEIFGARGSRVHHNRACENDAFTELGDADSADNVFAYNVVTSSLRGSIFVNTRGGESPFGPVEGTSVIGNSVRLTGAESEGFVCGAGCGPEILFMRNNIIEAGGKAGYEDAPFDEDFGLIFGGQVDFTLGPESMVADPRFVDPSRDDLRLAVDSPAVDSAGPLPDIEGLGPPREPVDGDGDGDAALDRGALEHPSAPAPRACR